jgi:Mn-containing catalase
MFVHNKRLMYTVRVSEPDPRPATLMLEQFGGPGGGRNALFHPGYIGR